MSAAGVFSRALVVDDLADVRAWLADALREAFPGIEVELAGSLGEAMAKIEAPPQIALIDLGLPDGSGTRLIEALRRRDAGTLCIVATVFDDDAHRALTRSRPEFVAYPFGAPQFTMSVGGNHATTAWTLLLTRSSGSFESGFPSSPVIAPIRDKCPPDDPLVIPSLFGLTWNRSAMLRA